MSLSTKKFSAKILVLVSRIIAIAYLTSAIYSIICINSGWCITPYGEGKFLHINYPFTQKPFLNIDNNTAYIIFSFLLPIGLYGLFFWLVSKLFSVFAKPKLFTHTNLMHLKKFYWFNWVVPLAAVVMGSFFVEVEGIIWLLVALHFILGLFAWMVAAIFKQGLSLQNEQDLFI